MKYGIISIERGFACAEARTRGGESSNRTINIGDYAQIIAIENLYHNMGIKEEEIVRIEYYDLFDYDGDYVILPINFIYFNPFYGERELIFSPKIIPVYLGIHCINTNYTNNEINYLKKFEPIGCRDEKTMNDLRKLGIEAYLQGCISVTLPKRISSEIQKEVYFVDIPPALEPYIPEEISNNAIRCSHQFYGDIQQILATNQCGSIRELMHSRLQEYREHAKLVVTSRLHCAAPCIAMGIPVIFVVEKYTTNYKWLKKLLPIYSRDKWDRISWKPTVVDCDDVKKMVLDYAIKRINAVREQYFEMLQISSFYESEEQDPCDNVYTIRIQEFAKRHGWEKGDFIRYGVWGVTQMADEVVTYMNQAYPYSELIAVVDEFRDLEFKSMKTIKKEELYKYKGVYFFGTGNSSSIALERYFQLKGWEEYACPIYRNYYEEAK